jgi:hypothetical protein
MQTWQHAFAVLVAHLPDRPVGVVLLGVQAAVLDDVLCIPATRSSVLLPQYLNITMECVL